MDPTTTVELPPKGADLGFLSAGGGGEDTPSKWLTFSGTPGNTTPGTAFGSPFWASLSRASPKAYSPSKELNPFELSFFTKDGDAGLHRPGPAAGSGAGGAAGPSSSRPAEAGQHGGTRSENIVVDDGSDSLKRPFEDAAIDSGAGFSGDHPSLLHQTAAALVNSTGGPSASSLAAGGNGMPAWKRPKFAATNEPPSYTNSSNSNSEAGMYGSSPAVGSNTSPDSGSPASTLIPTPNIQSAVLPGKSLSASGADQGDAHAKPNQQLYQTQQQLPLTGDDLNNIPSPSNYNVSASHNAYPAHLSSAGSHPAQAMARGNVGLQHSSYSQHFQQQGQQQYNAAYSNAHHFNTQHPGYSHQHQLQHQPAPQPLQPIILPPKHIAPGPSSARHHSPAPAAPSPTAPVAGQPSLDSGSSQQQGHNPNAIPYANGRGPSQQSATTTRSRRTKSRTAVSVTADEIGPEKHEEDDEDEDDHQAAQSVTSSTRSSSRKNAGGKKGASHSASADASSIIAGPTVKKEVLSASVPASTGKGGKKKEQAAPPPPPVVEKAPSEEPIGDDDDDETKRKAFLERNRQAACRSRQKKKEWIGNLENHAAALQAQNSALTAEIENLRKEMFALRHTLSFHERCGCPSIQEWSAENGPMPQVAGDHAGHTGGGRGSGRNGNARGQVQNSAGLPQQQQQPHGVVRQQQAPIPQTHMINQQPVLQPVPEHQQLGPAGSSHGLPTRQQPPRSVAQAPGHLGATTVHHGPQGAQQLQPRLAPPPSAAATLAPGVHHPQPLVPPVSRPDSIHLGHLNLGAHHQQQAYFGGNHMAVGGGQSQGMSRPGSAGATFGLSTPNFADLFGGYMTKMGGTGSPGGITFSPQLPNTFGLSMSDIPVRPASAPPTPSPALDTRLVAPGGDYFSLKGGAAVIGNGNTSFGDLFANVEERKGGRVAPVIA